MGALKPGLARLAVFVAGAAACLPMGGPPAGRQVVAGRGAALGAIIPAGDDGLLRVLVLRPGATSDAEDLSVIALDAANDPGPEVPLIAGIDPVYGVGCRTYGRAPCSVDPTGMVQVHGTDGIWKEVNAITGEIQPPQSVPTGPFGSLTSTSGGRSFQAATQTSGTLSDADGHTTPIQLAIPSGAPPYQFFGEDFYFLDPQQELIDIPPSDVPRTAATGVVAFNGTETPAGPVLLLTRVTAGPPAVTQTSVLDPTSGMETLLPFNGSNAELSADGQWVLDNQDQSEGKFIFFDYRSGTQQIVQIDGEGGGFPVWRPGTAEVWMTVFGLGDTHAVWVLRPDAPPVSVRGAYMLYVNMNNYRNQPFTDDGAYWFFTTTSLDSATQVVQVGRTDDPTGPAFPLNPPSTFLDLALPLPDGRLLTTAYPKDEDRSDVTVVDPRTGQSDVVARRGLLLTSGQTRVMGLFHIAEGRGDLTTIDLGTGQATVLAPEFTVTASAEPQGADALAPGARIVYQFQARTASPYDGIWVTPCP